VSPLASLAYAVVMPEPLTLDEVRHVAKLSRLRLGDEQLREYQHQLSSILSYMDLLSRLDVSAVQPMAHPTELTNRLADDVPGAALTVGQVLANAPVTEDAFIAVPKVLGEGGGA
jgi:aspartyl-tRNA(Asn)/glutamyl-tRNA(Gln) amidotransferase subunit C